MATIVQTKDDGAGFAALARAEFEAVSFLAVPIAATRKIRLAPDELYEHSIGFAAVSPGARAYTLQLWEDLPAPYGLCLRYSIVRIAGDLNTGELVVPYNVSFRHPIEIHLINGGVAGSYMVTYRMFDRTRLGAL